jgi:hypothetical protein
VVRDLIKSFWIFAAAVALGWPMPARAQQAAPPPPGGGLLVSPSYVLFDGRVRSKSLLLSNRGVTTETYRITIVNRLQMPDGQLVPTDKPPDGEGFVGPLVRYAPHEIVLAAEKPQTVRLLLQLPADLPDGEYRSHILFQQVPTETPSDSLPVPNAPGLSVSIRAIFGVTIPIIVRKGALTASASLSDLRLIRLAEEQPALALHINRAGTRSLRGDLAVLLDDETVGRLKDINVFLSTPYREVVVPLTVKGDIKGHRIAVRFNEDEEIPGAATATQALAP